MLEPRWAALRSVEIQRCFSSNPNANLAFLDLPHIMRMGQLGRLANMLRRREIISYEATRALGALLTMQPDTIDSNLQILKALSWIEIKKDSSGQILSIDESFPRLEEVLHTLGKLYNEEKSEIPFIKRMTEVERSSLQVLDMCTKKPCSVEAIRSELGLSETTYEKISRLGIAGQYFDPIMLDGKKPALWSPIYYYNRYDDMKKFFQRHSESDLAPIGEAIELCAETVGLPLEKLKGQQQMAARAGVKSGAILPITLWMSDGEGQSNHTFLFPALKKFEDSDPSGDVYEKAKVLMASIRLGEHFAPRSKIKTPKDVLKKLKLQGKLSNPYSYAFDQYRVPASRGLVLLKEEEGRTFHGNHPYVGWTPYLIKSEENIKALDIVESLLNSTSDSVSSTLSDDISTAEGILNQSLSCYETLEFRGAGASKKMSIDPKLEDAAQKFALTLHGGTYE